ncbi:MAG: hypothetical protein OXM88_10310, partial [bacterium]|nr:hypothetical protein [bacterium]
MRWALALRLLLVLVVFLMVSAVLSVPGVEAGSGDPPPGPCEAGWVAPTPVVVAVSEVPVVVSSTGADYFVLYVERP